MATVGGGDSGQEHILFFLQAVYSLSGETDKPTEKSVLDRLMPWLQTGIWTCLSTDCQQVDKQPGELALGFSLMGRGRLVKGTVGGGGVVKAPNLLSLIQCSRQSGKTYLHKAFCDLQEHSS